jgi:hypothetical protein
MAKTVGGSCLLCPLAKRSRPESCAAGEDGRLGIALSFGIGAYSISFRKRKTSTMADAAGGSAHVTICRSIRCASSTGVKTPLHKPFIRTLTLRELSPAISSNCRSPLYLTQSRLPPGIYR